MAAKKLLFRMLIRFTLIPIFMIAIVLLPAGTFRFWQLYLYLTVLMIPLIFAMTYFYRKDPDFIERRMKTGEREKSQRIFVVLSSFSILGAFIIPGLDRRLGWSEAPLWAILTADALVIISYLFIVLVFKTNTYASRVVEVAEKQKVISSGPYSIVRHPMYSGMLILYLATPIALASWWGVLPAALLFPLLALRISNEEKVLRQELEGYADYCGKVRFRLIPFIW